MEARLQKLIAQSGFASRRKAEALMQAGRVTVNGKIITELGSKADWSRDRIAVDAKPLRPAAATHILLLYKPKGVVTTLHDPEGRRSIREFLRGIPERLYPVGRLDFHSEGLLLLTNDGELANRVLRASTALPKTYWVKVAGRPDEEQLERLRRGTYIDGRRTAPAQIRWLAASSAGGRQRRQAGVYRTSEENPWLEVVLVEGRNHQIRKMFMSVGHPVEKLKRVAIGHLGIGALKSGQMRPLTAAEIAQLRKATGAAPIWGVRGPRAGASRSGTRAVGALGPAATEAHPSPRLRRAAARGSGPGRAPRRAPPRREGA